MEVYILGIVCVRPFCSL